MEQYTYDVSIIMPTYNQKNSLKYVLESFKYQKNVENLKWELIVIDDGSTDGSQELNDASGYGYPLKYIKFEQNKGRVEARNRGIIESKGKLLIFCDSDRAVCNDFIYQHYISHQTFDNRAVIGKIMEFYFSDLESAGLIEHMQNDYEGCKRFARKPLYMKCVAKMFEGEDNIRGTDYMIPWISFFSGNVSILKKNIIDETFETSFDGWGFEHFELGYRLFKKGICFVKNTAAVNYHFAHSREENFYKQSINGSKKTFIKLHNTPEISAFFMFLGGKISLEAFNNEVLVHNGIPQKSIIRETYFLQMKNVLESE